MRGKAPSPQPSPSGRGSQKNPLSHSSGERVKVRGCATIITDCRLLRHFRLAGIRVSDLSVIEDGRSDRRSRHVPPQSDQPHCREYEAVISKLCSNLSHGRWASSFSSSCPPLAGAAPCAPSGTGARVLRAIPPLRGRKLTRRAPPC